MQFVLLTWCRMQLCVHQFDTRNWGTDGLTLAIPLTDVQSVQLGLFNKLQWELNALLKVISNSILNVATHNYYVVWSY